jgi:hypothetical protein
VAAAEAPAGEHPPAAAGAGASPWRTVGAITSQTALLVAVLFYFGWASASETYRYFGVDISLLGFGTSDFLLRSIYSAYQPLLVLGLVALAGTLLHQWVLTAVARTDGRGRAAARRLPVIVLAAGVLAGGSAVLGLVLHPITRVLGQALPAVLAAGALLCAYADYLWPRLRGSGVSAAEDPAIRLRAFLLVSLAVLGGFWWIALYAVDTGHSRALRLAERLGSANEVAMYTAKPLAISGPDVGRDEFPQQDLRYRYRYTGLRLLIHADGQYFLLPRGWVRGRDSVVVVPDREDVRLEIIAGS